LQNIYLQGAKIQYRTEDESVGKKYDFSMLNPLIGQLKIEGKSPKDICKLMCEYIRTHYDSKEIDEYFGGPVDSRRAKKKLKRHASNYPRGLK